MSDLQVYADMVLTGQKVVALVPRTITALEVDSCRLAGLRVVIGVRGTYLWKYASAHCLVDYLEEHLDTSGSVQPGDELSHWVAGLAFGYGAAEINEWILKHRASPSLF